MKTKDLTICAVLSAMCTVLAYFSIPIGNIMKISFESFPILIGGSLLGPGCGMLIGGIGTFIYQLLQYGITLTTILWVLPYAVYGFIIGYVFKKNNFENKGIKLFLTVIFSELIITLLNTLAIYADSKMYGWYYPGIVSGILLLRLVIAFFKGIVYSEAIKPLNRVLKKALK